MAPHEFVEIRLVCKADYLDPQLKSKLHEIKDKLRELLHTGKKFDLNFSFFSFRKNPNRSKTIRIKKSAAVE